MRMYTGQARTHGALWPEEQEHAWEFYAETPWGKDLVRGKGALLIMVDDEEKVDLEELALKISLGLMVERVAFPLDPPEIPKDFESAGLKVARQQREMMEDDGGDLGIISRGIRGESTKEDLRPDEWNQRPLKGGELFPPMKRDDEDGVQ